MAFFCMPVSLCLSFIRTLVVTFKAHPDNSGKSHYLKIDPMLRASASST